MPHSLELPRMLRAVVPLMRGERLPALCRAVVNELVTRGFRRTWRGRFSGRRSGLKPGFATVIGALNDLSKPSARLRGVDSIRIGRRSLHVINFPARKVWATDLPIVAFAVGGKNECALASANKNSYLAHAWLLFCGYEIRLVPTGICPSHSLIIKHD